MIPTTWLLGGAAAALAVAGLAWQQSRLEGERANHMLTKVVHAEQLQRLADKTTRAYQALLTANAARQQAVEAADTESRGRLTHALADNQVLRDRVRDGDRRLRIAAICPTRPAAGADLPSPTASSGVAHGTTVELAPETGQAVLDLRGDLIGDREKVLGLQAYVRAGCRG